MATIKKSAKKYAMGGTVTTETTKKPVAKVVEKKTTVTVKKPKTVSQRIGDITLRDVKNSAEDALNLSTLGGYGVAKKKVKELTGMKSGGTMKKAKTGISVPKKNSVSKNIGNLNKAQNGKSFPDLNKDGKVTKKDILIGKGVLPKTAKKGAKIAKCKYGCK